MPKPITKLDRNTVNQLRKPLHAALTEFATAHGLNSVSVGSITYNPVTFTAKIKFMLVDAEEVAVAEFARHAEFVGLQPGDYGRLIFVGGHQYRVVGVNLRCRKYPISVRRSDGKMFKMTLNTICVALNRKPQA
jgi:hypothetical protein